MRWLVMLMLWSISEGSMMNVYIVTYQEDFGELEIIKAFSTFELALAYVGQFTDYNRRLYDIGEMEVEEK